MRFRLLLALALALAACSGVTDPSAPPWRRVASVGPAARWGHAAVYDAKRDRMIVFAGQSGGGELADVWALDLASETWTQLATGPGPAPRVNPAAVVDPTHDRMIVVGGRTGLATLFDDVWALDLGTLQWTELAHGPGPRQRAHYATDGTHAWFYGGEGFLSVFGNLWQLDFSNDAWTELPNAGDAPPSRTCGAMAFVDGALFVNGGHDVAFVRDGTWRYDSASESWSRLATSGGTAAGAHWAYAVDPACGTLVLAGGDHADNYDTALTDELSLRGAARFSRFPTSSLPDANDHASLVFDTSRRNVILFGGTLGDGQSYLGGAWVHPVAPCP